MRQLECAFQQAVSAVARDDLPSIARSLGVVHAAKDATAAAIAAGTWRPARGEVAAFVALDEAFHRELEALYYASEARDHGKTGEAMGRALGLCQACHATYRAAAGAPDARRRPRVAPVARAGRRAGHRAAQASRGPRPGRGRGRGRR
ncbi:MAG: cytochrome c [Kofleriaceae bacterium]|nr:cytochrome c [Kofleriaceae bacterium]